jgi:bacillithiol synthase
MEINTCTISFSQTGCFSSLIVDYIERAGKLEKFYSFFPDVEGFRRIINSRKYNFDRNLLADVITEQNIAAGINPSKEVNANIALLRHEDTFTVTTGHQLCVFTGPLYFIYKIFTTINLAEELKKNFPDKAFVPVFWLASEDHDFEEVNHIHLFDKKVSWNPGHAVKGPVGRLSPVTLSETIEELRSIMGVGEKASELYDLFIRAYGRANTLSEATRYLANELFSHYGLVCLDGDDKRLKEALKPVIKQDIFQNSAHQEVSKTIEELKTAGIQKPQVNPREINFFYMKPGLRERIEKAGEVYMVLNTDISFTKEALENEIENSPESFSPNVIIRPVYQEIILPNIAYIGGGGELAYWLELQGMFQQLNIDFPILLLRNSLLWISQQLEERMQKLDLNPVDLFKSTETLIKEFVSNNAELEINLEQQGEAIRAIYQTVSDLAAAVEPTLKPTVEAELQKALNGLKNLEHKIAKAEKHKHESSITQLRKLKEKLFPGDGLQERHDNFIPYYLKHGKEFFNAIQTGFNPLGLNFTIISEKVKQAERA